MGLTCLSPSAPGNRAHHVTRLGEGRLSSPLTVVSSSLPGDAISGFWIDNSMAKQYAHVLDYLINEGSDRVASSHHYDKRSFFCAEVPMTKTMQENMSRLARIKAIVSDIGPGANNGLSLE